MYVYQFKTIVFPVYLFQINIIELALLRQTPDKPVTTKYSTVFPQSKNREQTVIYYYYNDNFLLKLLKP
jgi:hypothetical protein